MSLAQRLLSYHNEVLERIKAVLSQISKYFSSFVNLICEYTKYIYIYIYSFRCILQFSICKNNYYDKAYVPFCSIVQMYKVIEYDNLIVNIWLMLKAIIILFVFLFYCPVIFVSRTTIEIRTFQNTVNLLH